MLTVMAVRNTAKTLGIRRACARLKADNRPIEVALAWLCGPAAVARFYERESNVRG